MQVGLYRLEIKVAKLVGEDYWLAIRQIAWKVFWLFSTKIAMIYYILFIQSLLALLLLTYSVTDPDIQFSRGGGGMKCDWMPKELSWVLEGENSPMCLRKKLTTHSEHLITVTWHITERGKLPPSLHELLTLLTTSVLLYAPFHRQDSTYHSLCYTTCGVLTAIIKSLFGSTMSDRSCFFLITGILKSSSSYFFSFFPVVVNIP